jgi:hypothetical protein
MDNREVATSKKSEVRNEESERRKNGI